MAVWAGARAAAARLDAEQVVQQGHHEVVVEVPTLVPDDERDDRQTIQRVRSEHLDVRVALPALDGSPDERFLELPNRVGANRLLELEDEASSDRFHDRRCPTLLAVLGIREVDVVAGIDVGDRSTTRGGRHAVREQVAARGEYPRRAGAADELVRADEDRILVVQLSPVARAMGRQFDVHVRCGSPEIPERSRAESVEQDGDCTGVADDPGDIRCRREASDLQFAAGVPGEFSFERREVDPPVGILGDRHHVGDGLAPRQLVGMVLVRPDEHDRALGRGDPGQEVVAIIEVRRQAEVQYVDQLVDRPGGPRTAEDDRVVVRVAAKRVTNDRPRVLTEPRRLESCATRFGMRVGIQRQDGRPDVVLDKRK